MQLRSLLAWYLPDPQQAEVAFFFAQMTLSVNTTQKAHVMEQINLPKLRSAFTYYLSEYSIAKGKGLPLIEWASPRNCCLTLNEVNPSIV